jgi:hypothetical protein
MLYNIDLPNTMVMQYKKYKILDQSSTEFKGLNSLQSMLEYECICLLCYDV